jgi:hypothetical protein
MFSIGLPFRFVYAERLLQDPPFRLVKIGGKAGRACLLLRLMLAESRLTPLPVGSMAWRIGALTVASTVAMDRAELCRSGEARRGVCGKH